ncbi:uncharacterized protein LOC135469039 [Liolophura sinensis]|uniref:uncharacterized protein LOC135469039 n=1 Tax=Liolophura sinensis TaxID=3198878 RepID=UPI0031581829
MELTIPELTSLLPQPVRQPSFFKTRVPTHIYGPGTQQGKVTSPLIKRLEGRFLSVEDDGLSYEDFTKQLKLYEEISKPVPREKSKVEIISEWKRERIKSGAVKPLVRFRRAVKSVQVLLRATDRSRHTGQITTPSTVSWVQIHNDLEINKRARAERGLLFDPDDYRAKRELQLSSEAKAILSMEPSKRTAEQLHVALVALNQSVEAFSEFPIKMQESLVRVGFYEHFEANRVIIRQGHFADNFYLIITGLAVVTILETDKQTGESSVRTAAFLKKGKSFGELALMHGALRSATVTCKDSVELLAVGRQDFINVFMHVEKNREPEHIQYLRSIDTFYGWPIEKLPYDNPKICLFTFFRKGVLLCRDSILSDWVYIIKTGTCKVLKELRIPKSDFFGKSKLNKTGSANHSSKTRTSSGQHGPSYLTTPSSSSSKSKRTAEAKRKLPCVRARCETELKTSSEEHLQKLTKIYSRVHPEPVADSEEINHTDKEVSDPIEASTSIDRNVSGNGNNNSGVSCTDILDPESEGPMPYNSANATRTTDQSRMKPKCNPNSACPEPNSVFVQVARLGPKDVFGLEHPILSALTPATSMSLVSDGAECILINRKFFMQHLTDVDLKRLRLSMQPYPTEEDLKRKLQNKQDWIAYKTRALNDHLAFTRHVQDTLSLYY